MKFVWRSVRAAKIKILPMIERRGYERFYVDGRVAIKSERLNCNISSASLNNLSFSGISVLSDDKIPVDEVVNLELTLKSSYQPLVGKGKIRYVKESDNPYAPFFRMGIEFVDINQGMVTYIIKRISFSISNEIRKQKKVKPLDFMPY